jgi:hypothetical protein
MEALTHIPFQLDGASLMKQVHLVPGSDDAREFEVLLQRAGEVGKPKALYRECFIEGKGEGTVTLGGMTFTSRVLRMHLEKAERVFVFVCTCGTEMDEVRLPAGDFLKEYWWDTIKGALLGVARAHLAEHLNRRFLLGKTATISPGTGDVNLWPIEQQRELFALLGDVKERIGVELTDSFLMVPNKTVSGVRFPTEIDFHACQVCHRENCPARSAPFDQTLWECIEHG